MVIPNWLTIDKSSGNKNSSVNITATTNILGERTFVLTLKAKNLTQSINCIQHEHSRTFNFIAVPTEGGAVNISEFTLPFSGKQIINAIPNDGYRLYEIYFRGLNETIDANYVPYELTGDLIQYFDEDNIIEARFIKQHHIKLYCNEGTIDGEIDRIVDDGTEAIISWKSDGIDLQLYNYEFKGWFTEPNGNGEKIKDNYLDSLVVKKDTTLYAYVELIPKIKTIEAYPYYTEEDDKNKYWYGGYGGQVSCSGDYVHDSSNIYVKGEVPINGSITFIAIPNEDYNFDGWYDYSENLVSKDNNYVISNITENIKIKAKFSKKYFTITYSKQEYITSITRTSERVAYGKTALGCTMILNDDNNQYDYEPDGWYIDSIKQISGKTIIPENVKADASYIAKATRTLNSYIISFGTPAYGSLNKTSQIVSYGSTGTCTIAIPADTAEFTYTWHGWYTATNGGGSRVSTDKILTTPVISGAVTYYPYVTRATRQYALTVSSNNTNMGTVSGGGTYNYNTKVTITATPKSGYLFKQWSDGNTSASREVTVTGAASYIATFEAAPYLNLDKTELVFSAEGGTQYINVTSNVEWTVS